uniref:Uncharacterized protein n=1 Tax=Arundo donax TaxID=35708 RepID=A0A0A9BIH5_ARUDO
MKFLAQVKLLPQGHTIEITANPRSIYLGVVHI